MKKSNAVLLTTLLVAGLISGCGSSTEYAAGTYIGKSSADDRGAYGEATITVTDGKITDCQYVTWQSDGTIKDENYGKVNGAISNADYYQKAQLAVQAMQQYATQLIEVQSPADVDIIAGATISHDQFVEAVETALQQATQS